MSYNQLRTLSFRLSPDKTLQRHRFEILKFPERWKSELRNFQAEITRRPPEQTNVPISLLNKGLRALVPDLIYIERYAAQSGGQPWLYSAMPINTNALHLIVDAWVKTQFSQAPEPRLREVLNQLRVEDLRWEPTTLDVTLWTVANNGTAELGGEDSFILLPHLLAASLSQNHVALEFGSERLRFRRAPLAPGAKGAELVSWEPIQYGEWYYSVVITLTVHTVPFQVFPVLHCDFSMRRWGSLPISFLPGDKETSVYLLTSVPWLEGLHQSNSFQVAPLKRERVPASEQQEGQPNYRPAWGSNLTPLLNRLMNRQRRFPTPEDIIANPASALNLNTNPSAAVIYRNGIEPAHGVGPGLGPADRRLLAEQIQRLSTLR